MTDTFVHSYITYHFHTLGAPKSLKAPTIRCGSVYGVYTEWRRRNRFPRHARFMKSEFRELHGVTWNLFILLSPSAYTPVTGRNVSDCRHR